MISKSIRNALLANPEEGPTLQALSHGAVEVRPLERRLKRGPIMAKRVGIHERLYARGKITDAEWNWACRYVKESEIAAGARLGKPEVETGEVWNGPLIYNRQCAAAGFLRRAHERITYQERLVLIAACVDCVVVADLGLLLGLARKADEPNDKYEDRISSRVQAACIRLIQQSAEEGCRAVPDRA